MSSRHPYVPYQKPIAGGRIRGSRYFTATSQTLHAEGRHQRIEAQVEQDAQLSRNIRSNLTVASSTGKGKFVYRRLERRGDRNIPKRYLKTAEWIDSDGYLEYYVRDLIHKETIPVEFNHTNCSWELVNINLAENCWITEPLPPNNSLGLDIGVDEYVLRSDLGPIDGEPEEESSSNPPAIFTDVASDTSDEPEQIDVRIPQNTKEEKEETNLAKVAKDIP